MQSAEERIKFLESEVNRLKTELRTYKIIPNWESRFYEKIEIITESGCWIWMGKTEFGYGLMKCGGKYKRVHRLSYEYFIEPIPSGKNILHRCNVRCCVNPKHLYAGSQKENIADSIKAGTHNFIKNNPNKKVIHRLSA